MIGHLQQVYGKYKDKGVVLVGIDCSDSKATAAKFLKDHGVTFPNIVDSSSEAQKVVYREYQTSGQSAVPLEYIIDRDGKIVMGWYGSGGTTGERAIEKLGIK